MLLRIAAATCDTPMPRAASLAGSSSTRTAYFAEPHTCTSDTPSTMDSRCAMSVSAYSSTCCIGSTADVSARNRIGAAAWFCLCIDGG